LLPVLRAVVWLISRMCLCVCASLFVLHTAAPEIYTLSLHDALPIWSRSYTGSRVWPWSRNTRTTSSLVQPLGSAVMSVRGTITSDRKSTRLNSSHQIISYAVFCLKKKKITKPNTTTANNQHHQHTQT